MPDEGDGGCLQAPAPEGSEREARCASACAAAPSSVPRKPRCPPWRHLPRRKASEKSLKETEKTEEKPKEKAVKRHREKKDTATLQEKKLKERGNLPIAPGVWSSEFGVPVTHPKHPDFSTTST